MALGKLNAAEVRSAMLADLKKSGLEKHAQSSASRRSLPRRWRKSIQPLPLSRSRDM